MAPHFRSTLFPFQAYRLSQAMAGVDRSLNPAFPTAVSDLRSGGGLRGENKLGRFLPADRSWLEKAPGKSQPAKPAAPQQCWGSPWWQHPITPRFRDSLIPRKSLKGGKVSIGGAQHQEFAARPKPRLCLERDHGGGGGDLVTSTTAVSHPWLQIQPDGYEVHRV